MTVLGVLTVIADTGLGLIYVVLAGILGYGVVRPQRLLERLAQVGRFWLRFFFAFAALAALCVAVGTLFDAAANVMLARLQELLFAP